MRFVRTLIAAAGAAATLCIADPAAAAEVAGVKFDEAVKVAGRDLKLNGLGVRVKAVFKVYALGLYLGKKESTTEGVLAAAGPRRVTLVMLRDMTGEDLGQAFMAGVNGNSDKAERSKFMSQVVKVGESFVTVASVKQGDVLHLDWVPEKGTLIELNGKQLGEPLPDQLFYNALLKIWLGEKPADTALKPLLLGNKPETLARISN